MILADTNVVLALLRETSPAEDRSLHELFAAGQPVIVPESVFVECSWVLRSRYGLGPSDVADALALVLSTEALVPWDPKLAGEALRLMRERPRLDLTDCLLAVRSRSSDVSVATMDRALAREIAQP